MWVAQHPRNAKICILVVAISNLHAATEGMETSHSTVQNPKCGSCLDVTSSFNTNHEQQKQPAGWTIRTSAPAVEAEEVWQVKLLDTNAERHRDVHGTTLWCQPIEMQLLNQKFFPSHGWDLVSKEPCKKTTVYYAASQKGESNFGLVSKYWV